MADCWKQSPKERPTFRFLVETIGGLLDPEVKNRYIQLNERYITMNIERNKSDLQTYYFNALTRTATAAQGFLRSINSVVNIAPQEQKTTVLSTVTEEQQNDLR